MEFKYFLKTFLLLLTAFVIIITLPAAGQQITEPSYNFDFVKGQYVDGANPKEIILFFRYSAKPGKEFKPIFSQHFAYSLGAAGAEHSVQFGSPNPHSIEIFGKDMRQKSPAMYALIKDKVDFKSKQKFIIAVFHLRALTDQYYPTMTYTYGFWEPENTNVRLEKKYEFPLDK